MIKAIIFDNDGAIIDSYNHTIYGFQKTLKFYHKKIPERKDFNKLLGLTITDIIKALVPGETEEKYHE